MQNSTKSLNAGATWYIARNNNIATTGDLIGRPSTISIIMLDLLAIALGDEARNLQLAAQHVKVSHTGLSGLLFAGATLDSQILN